MWALLKVRMYAKKNLSVRVGVRVRVSVQVRARMWACAGVQVVLP